MPPKRVSFIGLREMGAFMAKNLINFLVSPEIQQLIGNYGVEKYGMQLFTPCAGAEPK